MDTPEARGSSRKPTEAKNGLIPPIGSEYFMGIPRYNLGVPYPTPYMATGQTRYGQRVPTEAQGSSRKLTEAHGS